MTLTGAPAISIAPTTARGDQGGTSATRPLGLACSRPPTELVPARLLSSQRLAFPGRNRPACADHRTPSNAVRPQLPVSAVSSAAAVQERDRAAFAAVPRA